MNLTNAVRIIRSPHAAAGLPRTLRTPITQGAKYFDVVGDAPNSVVYNDGVQDLLVWVSTSGANQGIGPEAPGDTSEIISGAPTDGGGSEAASAPAAPEVTAPAPFQLTEPDVAEPGFNATPGGRR